MSSIEKGKEKEEQLPEEALERLHWYAEQHSTSKDKAIEDFLAYIEEHLGIVNTHEEDDDFLVDAAETFVVERRVMTGPGSSTTELVGCFVGVEPKIRDKRENVRELALQTAKEDLGAAIEKGIVARAFVENGVWMLEKAMGIVASTQDRFDEDNDPWFLVRDGGMTLAILQQNPDWARHGEPISPYLYSRTYRFYGNSPDKFEDDIQELRIDVSGPTELSVSQAVGFGESCRVKVRPQPDNVNQGWEDMWRGVSNFYSQINYTDDFVNEDDREYLKGDLLMAGMESYISDLSDLMDVYRDQSETVAGFDNPIGPLVCIKGKVTDINQTGYDSEYDPTGINYTMRVSSFSLQREFANDMWRQEVSIRVHGFLGQDCHAFDYKGRLGWKPYAVKSTVYIFGRLGLRVVDDGEVPTIRALGIYAPPRLAIPAGEGGNTSLDQFGGVE